MYVKHLFSIMAFNVHLISCSMQVNGNWVGTCKIMACPLTSTGAPNCQCLPGYVGTVSWDALTGTWQADCKDIDECLSDPCAPGSFCVNLFYPARYSCSLAPLDGGQVNPLPVPNTTGTYRRCCVGNLSLLGTRVHKIVLLLILQLVFLPFKVVALVRNFVLSSWNPAANDSDLTSLQ